MSNFIPELDNLRSAWVRSRAKRARDGQSFGQFWEKKAKGEFDRAIAKIRAEAKVEMIREVELFIEGSPQPLSEWLRARADNLEKP